MLLCEAAELVDLRQLAFHEHGERTIEPDVQRLHVSKRRLELGLRYPACGHDELIATSRSGGQSREHSIDVGAERLRATP